MNELVYVLAVEALIFGMICIVVVAQRVDVFNWPSNQTWPVLSTSLQILLVDAHALLIICCFISAGSFFSLASELRDACARSSGRLATATLLAAAYVTVLLALRGDFSDCVLCQLLDTTCTEPVSSLFGLGIALSHTAYLALLVPVAVFQTLLIVVASGLSKEHRVVPRRTCTCNCALLLAMQVQTALEHNASRLPQRCLKSGVSAVTHDSQHVIILLLVFSALDTTADILAYVVQKRGGFQLSVLFAACRAASLVAPWGLHPLLYNGILPWKLLVGHSALSLVLALLDFGDVWLAHYKAKNVATLAVRSDLQQTQAPTTAPLPKIVQQAASAGAVTKQLTAFEVEPNRRRRFVLAFNNKARWPSHQTLKKTA